MPLLGLLAEPKNKIKEHVKSRRSWDRQTDKDLDKDAIRETLFPTAFDHKEAEGSQRSFVAVHYLIISNLFVFFLSSPSLLSRLSPSIFLMALQSLVRLISRWKGSWWKMRSYYEIQINNKRTKRFCFKLDSIIYEFHASNVYFSYKIIIWTSQYVIINKKIKI